MELLRHLHFLKLKMRSLLWIIFLLPYGATALQDGWGSTNTILEGTGSDGHSNSSEVVDPDTDSPDTTGTPSPTCQTIVEDVGWAISNYTLCSVRNARPIHLCEKCVGEYLNVRAAYNVFEATIDEEGNICGDYFVNLDRLQIVSEAYKYVHYLWGKANCNSCFKRDANGTITNIPTEQTLTFDKYFRQTRKCFQDHTGETENLTCVECLEDYNNLTDTYIQIEESCGDAVCMDIVDTMNITRFTWSDRGCVKRQGVPVSLQVGIGLIALVPLTFYLLAYFLANKQEAPILQQKRLAEVFAVNSSSFTSTLPGPNPDTGVGRSSSGLGAFRRHPAATTSR